MSCPLHIYHSRVDEATRRTKWFDLSPCGPVCPCQINSAPQCTLINTSRLRCLTVVTSETSKQRSITLSLSLSLSNLILELSTPLFTRTRVEVSFLIVFFFGTSLVLYFFDICFLKSHYDFFFLCVDVFAMPSFVRGESASLAVCLWLSAGSCPLPFFTLFAKRLALWRQFVLHIATLGFVRSARSCPAAI